MKNKVMSMCIIGVLVFCIIFKFILFMFFSKMNLTIIWDFIDWSIWYCIVISTSIIIISLIRKIKVKKIRTDLLVFSWIASISICLGLVISNFLSFIITSPNNYYFFSSPNDRYRLVLIESENITGCTVKGYPVKLGIFKGECSDFASFAEPDLPINKGNYSVEWVSNNLVRVTVNSDNTTEMFDVVFN